jgi:dTDP-D-glucose 4,6-dehydratase
MGTHILLEAGRAHSIKRFIHVSTDEVYGETATQVNSSFHL